MADESSLAFERYLYIANILGAIIYGITLYVAFSTIYHISLASKRYQGRNKVVYIVYTVVMLISMTFAMLANCLIGQKMWIDHRDEPGGPFAYFTNNATVWYNVNGTAFDMFGNFLGDLLLLYRCYIVWSSNFMVILLPTLIFLGSTSMAIVACVQSALPNSNFYAAQAVNFAIPWVSLTCGLNVILTVLIAARLLIARYKLSRITGLTGSVEMTTTYTGIIAILVESALPFSVLGVIFAVLLGKSVPVYLIFSCIWGAYAGLAPMLIIYRVALGRAWSKETSESFLGTLGGTGVSRSLQFASSGESTADGNASGDQGFSVHRSSSGELKV